MQRIPQIGDQRLNVGALHIIDRLRKLAQLRIS
jgi:hypothetical protein